MPEIDGGLQRERVNRAKCTVARHRTFHALALELCDLLRSARAAALLDVRSVSLLKRLARRWQVAIRVLGRHRSGLARFGHAAKWKVSIAGVVEPGWHLALLAIVEARLLDPAAFVNSIDDLPDQLPKSTRLPAGVPMPLTPCQLALFANQNFVFESLDAAVVQQGSELKFELVREHQVLMRSLGEHLRKQGILKPKSAYVEPSRKVHLDFANRVITIDGIPVTCRSAHPLQMFQELGRLSAKERLTVKVLGERMGHPNPHTFVTRLKRKPQLWSLLEIDGQGVRLRPGVRIASPPGGSSSVP